MAVIQAEIKALQLRHPELDITTMAEIRGPFMERGRYTGHRLRFRGEHHDRCLRFAEIRALMDLEEDDMHGA